MLMLLVSLLHRVKMGHRGDVKDAIRRRGGGTDGIAKFDRTEHLLVFARGEDVEGAAPGSQINFPVSHERRGPDFAINLMRPMWLACLCVHTMNFASAIRDEDQTIVNRRRGHY